MHLNQIFIYTHSSRFYACLQECLYQPRQTQAEEYVEGVGSYAIGDGHRALALPAHDQAGDHLRNTKEDKKVR